MHRKRVRWSVNLAYAIGLIATDGCLSKDGKNVDLTSKDLEQIQNFIKILNISNKIGAKTSTYNPSGVYYRVQFCSVQFYRFLLKIGLTPKKSLTLGKLEIPDRYFIDFFRGCIDGDGNISIWRHPESQFPQLKLKLASASLDFLIWVKERIVELFKIKGGYISKRYRSIYILEYSKADSILILDLMYYHGVKYFLKRKFDYYQGMPK